MMGTGLTAVDAVISQLGYVTAHSPAGAATLIPLDVLRLPAAMTVAYFVLAEVPNVWTVVVAATIFLAASLTLRGIGARQESA
jgi:drug/metabolite transporter (DMT)-like permease